MDDDSTISSNKRIKLIQDYLDNILKYGRDSYGKKRGESENSPLFADGINVKTGEHLRWQPPKGEPFVVSNLLNQQNLFRTLFTLSKLLNDDKYINAAKAALKYHFSYWQDESGLLQWGGHRLINLEKLEISGNKNLQHELKNSIPFYELMYEVSPKGTIRF
ncbi:MAG: pectate lyase, partial [bacterium]